MRSRLPLVVLTVLAGCKSAEQWHEQADDEVYAILAERREELGATDPFTIDRPIDPLRDQLERDPTAPLTLDLVGCLRVAAENSRAWQDEREALYREALDLTLQRWDYTVKEEGTLGAFLRGTGRNAESEGFLANFNLIKLLGIGTLITADAGLQLARDVASGDWDALSHLTLNITQPILRGFGHDIVMEPLTQAERDVLYQARAYERFRRTFSVDIAQSFFNVLERQDRLKNEEANYANLQDLRKRNEALGEAGRKADVEVDQARQDELSAEDRVVGVRRDVETALDAFKFQLGLPITVALTLDEGGLRSLDAWQALFTELSEEQVIQIGLQNRLDHRTALDRMEDARRGVKVAADALRTGLNLTAAGAYVGEGDPDTDDFTFLLGVDVDLPIERMPERNAYRRALIEVESSHRAAQQSGDLITAELRESLRSLQAARTSYDIQSGSVVLAQRRVDSASLNLDAGRVSTRDVLEAQESLLDAQNTLASSLTDAILAGLFLYRDMELLDVTDRGLEVLSETAAIAQPSSRMPREVRHP